MSLPTKLLKLDRPSGLYQPRERLNGYFLSESAASNAFRAAELSVVWYTAGHGEEDFEVHHFERLVDEPAQPLELRAPRKFSVVLPASPLSYDGRIVKICWCVRLRLFPRQGPEVIDEAAFRLGEVPMPEVIDK